MTYVDLSRMKRSNDLQNKVQRLRDNKTASNIINSEDKKPSKFPVVKSKGFKRSVPQQQSLFQQPAFEFNEFKGMGNRLLIDGFDKVTHNDPTFRERLRRSRDINYATRVGLLENLHIQNPILGGVLTASSLWLEHYFQKSEPVPAPPLPLE